MKRNILFVLAGLFAFQFATANDVVTKDVERLPLKAKELISAYFPSEKISYIKIDEEILTTTYDVVFVSGTEIDFTEDGIWKDIDCKRSEVPAGVIPEKIALYVRQNFADAFITKIEKDGKKYEVELSNRLDLYFDRNFDFIGLDD